MIVMYTTRIIHSWTTNT